VTWHRVRAHEVVAVHDVAVDEVPRVAEMASGMGEHECSFPIW
jgi:hypothetical protein